LHATDVLTVIVSLHGAKIDRSKLFFSFFSARIWVEIDRCE